MYRWLTLWDAEKSEPVDFVVYADNKDTAVELGRKMVRIVYGVDPVLLNIKKLD